MAQQTLLLTSRIAGKEEVVVRHLVREALGLARLLGNVLGHLNEEMDKNILK